MLISHSQHFIFVHVAKVAGLSLRDALEDYVEEPEHFRIKRPAKIIHGKPNVLYAMWKEALLHPTALQIRTAVGDEMFNSYFKFAFVRNPWDLQVSMYHFILKETQHRHHHTVKAMANFTEYLEWMMATPKPFTKGATKFQKDMLCDEQGQVLVDFVGRYENLTADFEGICQRLNIQSTIAHLNQSHHRDYPSYYDQKSRELVTDYFQEDIALFGYEFVGYQNTADYMQRTW
jgi:Sulfotransferase family